MTNESGPPEEGAKGRPALTAQQEAALKQLAAGEGDPFAIAEILRPVAHLLKTPSGPDNELVRWVRLIVSAFTSEQGTALKNIYAGEGTVLAAAKVLRPVAEVLDMIESRLPPLPSTLLVRRVRGLIRLSDVILAEAESSGTPLDQAAFIGHCTQSYAFDGPRRRADFYRRAIAELKSLEGAHTEECGDLSRLLTTAASSRRCHQCYERPVKQCEFRIVDKVASKILAEQKDDQRRTRAESLWYKSV
jgi:hypothetical protein